MRQRQRLALPALIHWAKVAAMACLTATDSHRARMIGALGRAYFAGGGWLFDCPLCGGEQDLGLWVYDDAAPGDLFNFACFCGCEHQKVADEMARRARRRRR
jgi:hypothetical protein